MGAVRARRTSHDAAPQSRPVASSARLPAPDQSTAAAVAWLVALPCAALAVALVVVLGPPLSRLLYPADTTFGFLPGEARFLSPEPLENTRYLLMWGTPLLLASATLLALRRWRPPASRATRLGVAAAQAAGAAFVLACLVAQRKPIWGTTYFNRTSLALAALLAAAIVAIVRVERLRTAFARALRDTRARQLVAGAIALAAAVVWVMPAINTEVSSTWAFAAHDAPFHLDESFAVLDHLTPLTDFDAQYASLLPYLIAPSLLAFGKTLLVFTITVCTLSVLSFMALYGALRRAAGSALAALLLFVPVLATALFTISGDEPVRFTFGTYFPMFPLRFAGPCLLAWLLARHLDGARPRALWALSLAAGVVLLNNLEFGALALLATLAALVATLEERSARTLLRLGGRVAAGVGAAIVAYALVSLVRAGELPRFGRELQFARLYTSAGYSNFPLPGVVGLQLVIFATYVAAIGTAVVRAAARAEHRALTGLLAWTGIFGIGSASYYVARSGPVILPSTFAWWALSLALLTIVAVRGMAAHPRRLPGLATLAALWGIGIAASSIGQLPTPGEQLARIDAPPPRAAVAVDRSMLTAPIQPDRDPRVRAFVVSLADGPDRFASRDGAPIALFATQGHRIADAYGVVDVVPYTGPESIHTVDQLEESLDALRDAGGNTALVPRVNVWRMRAVLGRRGFAVLTRSGLRRVAPGTPFPWRETLLVDGLTKWVDMRHLHPAALSAGS